jgi:lipoprotein-anchoring transpeptidase ErfK/SrfK
LTQATLLALVREFIQADRDVTVTRLLTHFAALTMLALLAACGTPHTKTDDAPVAAPPPGYEAVQDGDFLIPAVEPHLFYEGAAKTEVVYNGPDAPGTIVVDTFARKLYYVEEGGMAMRYAIAVGREGISFKGTGVIGRKEEWPGWTPTANMVRTRPDLYAEYAGGLPGGLDNPLGARAMYLYRGGKDSKFRIHGTIENASIGHATSAGCIRLFNQDAIDLYNRIDIGAKVRVRTLAESLELEGPFMNDAYGRAVPDTPENQAQKLVDEAHIAELEALDPALAAYDAAARAADEAAARQAAGG